MNRKSPFLKLLTLILLFTNMLTACSAKGSTDHTEAESSPQTINGDATAADSVIFDPRANISMHSEHIEKELDTFLQVNADVILPGSDRAPVFEVNLLHFNFETLSRLFVSERGDSIPDTVEIKEEASLFLTTANGNTLRNWKGMFSYETADAGTCLEIINFDMEKRLFNLEEPQKNALAFQSREQAWKTVENTLSAMGMPGSYAYSHDIYAFDHLTLETEQTRLQNEDEDYKYFADAGKIRTISNWSDKNDIYYISFTCLVMGVPMSDTTFSLLDEQLVPGFRGEALVSVNGLEGLWLQNVWEEPIVKSEGEIISLDSLMTCIRKKYEDIILTDMITVKEIRFEYCAVPDQRKDGFLLTPVFTVTIERTLPAKIQGKEPDIHTMNLYFSAAGGEEIR